MRAFRTAMILCAFVYDLSLLTRPYGRPLPPRWIDMHVYRTNDAPVAVYSLGDEMLKGGFFSPTALVRLPVGLPFDVSGVGDLLTFCKIGCEVLGLYAQAVNANDMVTTPNSTVTWDTPSGYPGVSFHGAIGPE